MTTPRLPVPGSDDNTWGSLLNQFLTVAHGGDGTLRANAVSTSALADGVVTSVKLDATLLSSLTPPPATVFDVRAYGALGNGIANDAPAFQGAVDAAQVHGGTVFIPSGSYLLGATVQLRSSGHAIVVRGEGWSSAVVNAPGTGIYAFTLATDDAGHNIGHVFEDFSIDCHSGYGETTGGGIFAFGAIHCHFNRLHIHHHYDNAIWIKGDGHGGTGHHNRVVSCLIDNGHNASALAAHQGRGLLIEANDENYVALCDFENNGNPLVNGSSHVKDGAGINSFVQNVFVGGTTAIKFQDCTGSRFLGNMLDGQNNNAVGASASSIQIIGNYFSGVGDATASNAMFHLYLDFGGYNTIVGNTFATHRFTQEVRGFISHQPSTHHNVFSSNTFVKNGASSLGDGGVLDWNGGSATAQSTRVHGNVGLDDSTSAVPVSTTAPGAVGDIAQDANYVYVCVATNTWRRSALTSW